MIVLDVADAVHGFSLFGQCFASVADDNVCLGLGNPTTEHSLRFTAAPEWEPIARRTARARLGVYHEMFTASLLASLYRALASHFVQDTGVL
jgi:hypothetical protein